MEILTILLLLIISLVIHEFAHAYIADKLGDPTPRYMGRVTLNPIKHLDPMGTAILIFTTLMPGPSFGWGKPVIFNPSNLKNPKRDTGLVAFAGPASNLIMALVGIIVIATLANPLLATLLQYFVILNVILAIFNLIPIYPLDGFNVMQAILPEQLSLEFQETSKYGMFVLILLIFTGAIRIILTPVLNAVTRILSFIQ